MPGVSLKSSGDCERLVYRPHRNGRWQTWSRGAFTSRLRRMIPPQLTRSQRVIRDMLDYRQEHLLGRRDIGPELVRDLVDWPWVNAHLHDLIRRLRGRS